MNRKDVYSTQAEAVKAAREFFWGTVSFAKRECLVPAPLVTANVNGHDVLIDFDNYGRLYFLGVVRIDKISDRDRDTLAR